MKSHALRHIRATKINGVREGPGVLIVSGIHGDEYEPVAATTRLSKLLPDVLICGSVTIVPVANLPAFKNGSRRGDDDLDLARVFPGNSGGTVTEAIASELSVLIRESNYVIDLHTGGNKFELAPFSGFVLHQSEDVLNQQYQMAVAFNLESVWATSPNLDGRSLSVARDHNIPAIYAEFGGGGGLKREIVKDYVQGCMNVLAMLGMVTGGTTSSGCKYVVKDYRDGSGNLDQLNTAPCSGLFESEVRAGDFVAKGGLIGQVFDPETGESSPVLANEMGMVFLIRSLPSVNRGDSLYGIWPITRPGETVIS